MITFKLNGMEVQAEPSLDHPGHGQILRPGDPHALLHGRAGSVGRLPAVRGRDRRRPENQAGLLLHLSGRGGPGRPHRHQTGPGGAADDDRADALDRADVQGDPGPGLEVRRHPAAVRAAQRGMRLLRSAASACATSRWTPGPSGSRTGATNGRSRRLSTSSPRSAGSAAPACMSARPAPRGAAGRTRTRTSATPACRSSRPAWRPTAN